MFKQEPSNLRRPAGWVSPMRLAFTVLLPVVAGWVGYYAGAMREPTLSFLPKDATVALNYRVTADSFSEVAQARAVLDALADRYVEDAQMMIVRDGMKRPAIHEDQGASTERWLSAAIRMLEEAVVEFEGSSEELQLLPTLLGALKREQRPDRWLDVYLQALYEHPTHQVIGRLAQEALMVGRNVGREAEVTTALRFVTAIPLEFDSKSRVERCLFNGGADFQTARLARETAIVTPQS